MKQFRPYRRRQWRSVAVAGMIALSPPALQAQSDGVRTFIVGRYGWVNVASEMQATIRGDLVDPGDLGNTAGSLVLSCDRSGYHLHFTADRNSRVTIPDAISDGYVHFTFAATPEPERISLYVKFFAPLTFQSAEPAERSGDEAGRFFELLLSDALTATAVISPRLSQGQFQSDTRIRLIFDPAPVEGIDRRTALAEFASACVQRRGLSSGRQ